MKIIKRGENTWRLFWEVGVDSTTGKRQQRTETFHGNKKSAEKHWREVQADIDQGAFSGGIDPTVRELLTRWQRDVLPLRVKPTTLDWYGRIIRNHLLPAFGDVKLSKLTAADIQAFYQQKLQEGERKDQKAGALTPTTVRAIHATLRGALEQAVKWGFVLRNVADLTTPPTIRQPEMKTWTAEEATAFLAATKGDRLHVLYLLALSGGLREGELLGLRWQDIDLETGAVAVRQNLVRVGAELRFGTPKSGKARVIDIGPDTVAVLRKHRARMAEELLALGQDYKDMGLVFPSQVGTPMHPRNLYRSFKAAVKKAGVPDIRFHDVRHTVATLLLASGANPKVVQERMGHHTAAFTMDRYAHATKTMQREAATAIEGVLKPSGGKMGANNS